MFITVTFLILFLRFPYIINNPRPCRPNSQILVNGKICKCNNEGLWSEDNCVSIQRRQTCQPGQVIFQGCSHCVCQDNGQMSCSYESCATIRNENVKDSLSVVLPWCNPFRTYYINCNICVCPATGKTVDARCVLDVSCSILKEPSNTDLASKKNTCLPKVMYLFPCLHCLCSDEGVFDFDKCVETCVRKQPPAVSSTRRCIPRTVFRKGCNVCRCPENGVPEENLCTKTACNHSQKYLRAIKNKSHKCVPYKFTKPRCVYCDCSHAGTIDERSCLELLCLKSNDLKYDVVWETCSPGEMVPVCTECFCPRSGVTTDAFCSLACSLESKLKVLEKILSLDKLDLILDKDAIKRSTGQDSCEPNSIYTDKGRYCICPENGNTNFNLCTPAVDAPKRLAAKESVINIDFTITCEPSTFVDFDCNVCYCSKKGKIDPKWCTYDDCEAKRVIQESHISPSSIQTDRNEISDNCNPGSIFKVQCNYCICPEDGSTKNRVCTKNDCAIFGTIVTIEKFPCEPLAYYEVDCNICFCPKDGLKNVARCTKNHCEKSFLRADVCVAGQLFIDECNVCVCPPNGNKAESACTNYTCTDTAPWKKIFQLSESLLGNQIAEDATRHLDLCFPGEEFVVGCKLCVCPDMGLRSYATCSASFCDEENHNENHLLGIDLQNADVMGSDRGIILQRKVDTRRENCMLTNVTSTFTQECKPGPSYIKNFKECICPYAGSKNHFCRPLPQHVDKDNSSTSLPNAVQHNHTYYACSEPGRIMDECFMCECENGTVIAEHCFLSDVEYCQSVKPSFFKDDK